MATTCVTSRSPSWRRQIGLVSQDAVLFNRTVADNIRYGRPEAPDREIREAARAAHALEFIERCRGTYGHRERGATCPPESASHRHCPGAPHDPHPHPRRSGEALDAGTSLVGPRSPGSSRRTAFVIAHRLSTVRHVSRIVVLDRGEIVQTGSHDSLVAAPGLYRRLYELQALGDARARS
jgi:ABC-type transport system involved in cytochrome bd biosynthesis fused ATPase/permease subunit